MKKSVMSAILCILLVLGSAVTVFASENDKEPQPADKKSVSVTSHIIKTSISEAAAVFAEIQIPSNEDTEQIPSSETAQDKQASGSSQSKGQSSSSGSSQGSSSGSSSGSQQASNPSQSDPATQASMASAVSAIVNQYRAAQGLSALTLDSSLCKVAQTKAEDMIKNGYFDHVSPTYGLPSDMLAAFNISYFAAGENIARGQGTAQAVMDTWMNSEMHRSNILSPYFTRIGVGYALTSSGQPYWVQIFVG